MGKFIYSEQHLEFLRNGFKWMAICLLTKAFNSTFALNKTEGEIRSTLKNHRIVGGRAKKKRLREIGLISREKESFIRAEYKNKNVADLTDALNKRFGTQFTKGQLRSYISRKGIHSGRDGRFVEGSLPWNDGLKGQGVCKPNSGSFKKGSVPGNIRDLGAERICSKDGFVLVKVAERNPYTGAKTRFKFKHVVIYENLHGPVPKGHVVRFADGDKHNFSPDNLILVSRAEHLRLTKLGLTRYPDELRPSVIAIAKLEVKMFSRMKKATI